MMEHYFSPQPHSRSHAQLFEVTVKGKVFIFETDAGVFSKSGIDFGSRLLIEHMEIPPQANVLDMGCGYGPIGIVAASMEPTSQVVMVDINGRAVQLARENIRRNGLSNVEVFEGDGFSPVRGRGFDTILMNPPIRAGKEVVFRLYEEACDVLLPGGKLWVVIQKKQGADSTKKFLEKHFTEPCVKIAARDKGYRVFVAKKKKI